VLYILLLSFLQISLGKKGETEYTIVALQGDRQVRLTDTPKDAAETFQQFMDLTKTISERRQKGESLPDLIIFPETVCPIPVLAFEGTVTPADLNLTDEEATEWERWYRQFVQQIDTPVIFGVSTLVFKDNPEKPLRLNSALLVQPQRGEEPEQLYRYDKMHLVMFGEYVPFANYLPDDFILRTLCPEATPGDKPVAFPIGWAGQGSEEPVMASINICFESSVAHLIRNQVLSLRKQGHDPRVLINLSNVGWFWFSQQIEQHLATHVFRAVENRMWYVTATNGGYSAIISPLGEIKHVGNRGTAEPVDGIISINLQAEHSLTLYQKYGDGYALLFAIITLGLAMCAWRRQETEVRRQESEGM
jgi:apolipoprotein N-acyltransferase